MLKKMLTIVILLAVFAIVVLSVSTAVAVIVTQDLVSLWTFDKATIKDDTFEDSWGKNDGTITGDPQSVSGKIGQALRFDGVDDILEVPNSESLQFDQNAITMSVWIQVHSGDDNWILYDGHGGRAGYAMVHDDRNDKDTFGTSFWNTAGTRYNLFGDGKHKHKPDTWHHVVGLLDGKQMKLYVNGEFEKEMAFEGQVRKNNQDPFHIGSYGFAGGYFVDGTIDEVAIYNRALSEAEIKNNYNSTTPVRPRGKLSVCWGEIKALK
jgi:hypothetical protein